jgi:hypothetical protein
MSSDAAAAHLLGQAGHGLDATIVNTFVGLVEAGAA